MVHNRRTRPGKPMEPAICFAEVLAEELVEMDALRHKRGIKNHSTKRNPEGWEQVKQIAASVDLVDRPQKSGHAAVKDATAVVGEARDMAPFRCSRSGSPFPLPARRCP